MVMILNGKIDFFNDFYTINFDVISNKLPFKS